MSDLSLNENGFTQIIDRWLKAEQDGERFPVDFDIAWQIAGYSRKDHAKRKLTGKTSYLIEGEDFAFLRSGESSQGGRFSDLITMSCDTFKKFCLMARTEQGDNIRQYFIEAESNWKVVETYFPQVASEVELIQLKTDLTRLELQKSQAELALLQKREYITTVLPKPIGDRILGVTEVKEIEYRDRIIKDDDVINNGSTINKTKLCYRYGILTKGGKPDYKRLNQYLERLPLDAFRISATIQENRELECSFLPALDQIVEKSDRQLWLGEDAE